VELVCGDRIVGEARAEEFRSDLRDQHIGDGKHGFRCALPAEVLDGHQYSVRARVKGGHDYLPGGAHVVGEPLAKLEVGARAPGRAVGFEQEALAKLDAILGLLANGSGGARSAGSAAGTEQAAQGARSEYLAQEFRRSSGTLADVVIFGIIDWHFRIQRPQHLASNFARLGSRVLYVNAHLERYAGAGPRFRLASMPAAGVFEVVISCEGEPESIYAGFKDPVQLRSVVQSVDEMVAALGLRSPAAVLHYPTWLPVASCIPGVNLVFDCLDHLAGFETASPEVLELEKDLIGQANHVVTSSQYLFDEVARVRPSTLVRNAAEVEFFSVEPLQVKRFDGRKVIGYYGAISEWFDVEFVKFAARARQDWLFVLVGSTHGCPGHEELRALDNVVFTGEVPYRELTSYLYAFDCCIIPFKLTELIKATNPVKLYEYFAAGKPVVATEIPELKLVPQHLLRLARTPSEFVVQVGSALEEGARHVDERRLFAMQNSWLARARDFLGAALPCPRVSVVILSYNGLELTRACIDSVLRFSNYPNLEVIVVDNMSKDGSRDYLAGVAESTPEVKVILNDENLGFSGGNNVGIRASTGDYVVLLNNDTYVTQGWVMDLIRPMLRDAQVGLTGPVTNAIGNEQKIRIDYANMEQMGLRSRLFTLGRFGKVFPTRNLAFFCVCLSRAVIERVGLLDEAFGIGFFEDDDYCNRARAAGFKLLVADNVFVHHHLSGSFDKEPERKAELMRTNLLKYEQKWGKWQPHSYRAEAGFGG
jgi:GT2 family glycosyltransferase/glycosyltransferase involved in cell wall biosynthesis